MKKTQLILLLRNIWATRVSFISILLFVGLGIGIFLGIKWNQPALANSADSYYERQLFQDLGVSYPYGISGDDLAKIEALPDVSIAEGAYLADGSCRVDGVCYALAIQSLTEKLNIARAVQGALPKAADELGVEQAFAEAAGLELGDTLTITAKDKDDNYLLNADFRITAIVEHPAYMSLETEYSRGCTGIGDGAVDFYVLMAPEAFNQKTYDKCFSNVYIRCDSLRGINSYTEEYRSGVDSIAQELKTLSLTRAPLRFQAMTERFNKEIADAEKQIADGEKQISDADKEISDADKEMADAKKDIAEGERELAAARQEYWAGEREYSAASKDLASSLTLLSQELSAAGFSAEPDQAKTEIEALLADCSYAEGLLALAQSINDYTAMPDSTAAESALKAAALQALQAQLAASGFDTEPGAALAEINADPVWLLVDPATLSQDKADAAAALAEVNEYFAARWDLAAGRAELDAALGEINDGQWELKNAKTTLSKAEKDLAEAKKNLEKGRKELEDGKKDLAKAKKDVAQLYSYDKWTVEKRSDNASYDMAKTYGESSKKLCYSMALLFVFVGLMVCYTAVSRIVREQQQLTGVQKALGFTKGEVIGQYMAYSVLTVLLGSVLGGALGYFGVEAVMNASYGTSFVFGEPAPYFCWSDLLIISGIELALICFATWLACRRLLSKRAVELLRGEDHSRARSRRFERSRWWNSRTLYTQTIINNLLGDAPRVIATLVGVAGCTALVVMALSLQQAIINTPERHFSDIFICDEKLVADDSVPDAMEQLQEVLDAEGLSYTPLRQKAVFIEKANGDLYKSELIVPGDMAAMPEFLRFYDASGGGQLAVPEEGILISQTYTHYHGVGLGDEITLMDMDGKRHSCFIAGVTEHYLSTYQIVMSPEYYESVMGKAAVNNTFYIDLNGADPTELGARLRGMPACFAYTNEYLKWSELFAVLLESTSLAVYIALFLSAVMAMLVLLNLNVVFISEKAKELIVMRINGFTVGETKKYIYRDNIVLTLLGIIIGVGLGVLLGLYVIISIQSEGDNILKEPSLLSCAAGAAVGGLFAVITNLIALRRVGKLRLSDLDRL